MDHHQLKITLPGNADIRHHVHATRAPPTEDTTYPVAKVFHQAVTGYRPVPGSSPVAFENTGLMYDANFTEHKYLSQVYLNPTDPAQRSAHVFEGHALKRGEIVVLTAQQNTDHNGVYLVYTDYYDVGQSIWSAGGPWRAIDMVRLSDDARFNSMISNAGKWTLRNDVSTSAGGSATWGKDEYGNDMFTYPHAVIMITAQIPGTGTWASQMSNFAASKYEFTLTEQVDSTRNGYYSNIASASGLEFKKHPIFDYGAGATTPVHGNFVEADGSRSYAKADAAGDITFMPGETLYISEPDGVMQSITVDAHVTRIRGVDGKIKWHVPQSGPQTITFNSRITHPHSKYTDVADYMAVDYIKDGTHGETWGGTVILIQGMPIPAANGIYQFKEITNSNTPQQQTKYERIDGWGSTHSSATGNALYAQHSFGLQYTVEMTHPDASKSYLQTTDNYIPGYRGELVHLDTKPNIYRALGVTAPPYVTGGHLDIGRQFTANGVSMTHTTFTAVFGTDVSHGSTYDTLVRRGLAVVIENDVLPHHAHSASGTGNECNREPHFHIHLDADKPFTSTERHNVHYKALRIPADANFRYVFEDTGEDLDGTTAAVIAKCTITLNFIGHLL